jgi:hypothetical protein
MTLARIAGHRNVSLPDRYVHSSEDAVLTAMAKLGGHKMGQSEEQTASSATVGLVLTRLLTDPDGTCPVRTKPSLQRRSK